MPKFNVGDKVYIIENGIYVKEVIIVKIAGGFYTIKKPNGRSAYRVKEGRLYSTELEANAYIKSNR